MDVVFVFPNSEIIVINDCSTDNTRRILEAMKLPQLKVINNFINLGHGASVFAGLKRASGEYILYIDADRQIELSNLQQLKDAEAFDIVSGWRIGRHDPLFRKFISFMLKSTNLLRHRMYIKDANCPFKLYKRSSLLPLLEKLPHTYVVPIADLEVLARRQGLTIRTIPTPHKPYDGVRVGKLMKPTLRTWLFAWDAFKEVVRL